MTVWTPELKAQAAAKRAETRAKKKANGHAEHISEVRREAVMSRWESVQREQENWLKPFHDLDVERAMRYLEDLRIITVKAGNILNARINDGKNMKCAGPHCGKDLSGLKPNGLPKWIAKKDFKDKDNPEIWHVLYFCSELCNNEWVRKQQGAAGGDGK